MSDTRAAAVPDINVLVVDDIEQNRLAMKALIERPGVRVLNAASGVEALELLLDHEVALALLDVQMPEMDGFELAQLMRGSERTRAVPIIFVTAAPIDTQRSFRGYEAGAVDFLYKPLDPNILCSKVNVFVELYAGRRQLHTRMIELESALSLNELMVAVLTHDLRTPLSAIALTSEVLLRTAADENVRQNALRLKSSSARMARMIAQLLDFSRIRSGTLRLEPRRADIGQIFSNAIAEMRQVAPEARIELRAEGDLVATLDNDRMTQVVSNLLSNAVQHGTPGGTVAVAIDGHQPDLVRVEVTNQGSITPEVQSRLFEPFRTDTAGTDGLGLGLYIVAQFVKAHGGAVFANARQEGRVAFGFTIPRRQANEGGKESETRWSVMGPTRRARASH
jgi:two-component system sensor histidine kinase/response regulator